MALFSSGIPALLPPGMLSIYGTRSTQDFSLPFNSDLTFGVINQLSPAYQSGFQAGQNVLFPFKEAYSLIYGNVNYFLIDESKIVFTELALIPTP
jgi:hypothetical protein